MLKKNIILLPFGTNKKGNYFDLNNINIYGDDDYKFYGQIEHPKTNDVYLLKSVSHMITNVSVDNFAVYGDVKVLDTESGLLLKELIDADLVVFRPRIIIENNVANIYTFDAISRYEDIYYDNIILRYKKLKKINGRITKND